MTFEVWATKEKLQKIRNELNISNKVERLNADIVNITVYDEDVDILTDILDDNLTEYRLV